MRIFSLIIFFIILFVASGVARRVAACSDPVYTSQASAVTITLSPGCAAVVAGSSLTSRITIPNIIIVGDVDVDTSITIRNVRFTGVVNEYILIHQSITDSSRKGIKSLVVEGCAAIKQLFSNTLQARTYLVKSNTVVTVGEVLVRANTIYADGIADGFLLGILNFPSAVASNTFTVTGNKVFFDHPGTLAPYDVSFVGVRLGAPTLSGGVTIKQLLNISSNEVSLGYDPSESTFPFDITGSSSVHLFYCAGALSANTVHLQSNILTIAASTASSNGSYTGVMFFFAGRILQDVAAIHIVSNRMDSVYGFNGKGVTASAWMFAMSPAAGIKNVSRINFRSNALVVSTFMNDTLVPQHEITAAGFFHTSWIVNVGAEFHDNTFAISARPSRIVSHVIDVGNITGWISGTASYIKATLNKISGNIRPLGLGTADIVLLRIVDTPLRNATVVGLASVQLTGSEVNLEPTGTSGWSFTLIMMPVRTFIVCPVSMTDNVVTMVNPAALDYALWYLRDPFDMEEIESSDTHVLLRYPQSAAGWTGGKELMVMLLPKSQYLAQANDSTTWNIRTAGVSKAEIVIGEYKVGVTTIASMAMTAMELAALPKVAATTGGCSNRADADIVYRLRGYSATDLGFAVRTVQPLGSMDQRSGGCTLSVARSRLVPTTAAPSTTTTTSTTTITTSTTTTTTTPAPPTTTTSTTTTPAPPTTTTTTSTSTSTTSTSTSTSSTTTTTTTLPPNTTSAAPPTTPAPVVAAATSETLAVTGAVLGAVPVVAMGVARMASVSKLLGSDSECEGPDRGEFLGFIDNPFGIAIPDAGAAGQYLVGSVVGNIFCCAACLLGQVALGALWCRWVDGRWPSFVEVSGRCHVTVFLLMFVGLFMTPTLTNSFIYAIRADEGKPGWVAFCVIGSVITCALCVYWTYYCIYVRKAVERFYKLKKGVPVAHGSDSESTDSDFDNGSGGSSSSSDDADVHAASSAEEEDEDEILQRKILSGKDGDDQNSVAVEKNSSPGLTNTKMRERLEEAALSGEKSAILSSTSQKKSEKKKKKKKKKMEKWGPMKKKRKPAEDAADSDLDDDELNDDDDNATAGKATSAMAAAKSQKKLQQRQQKQQEEEKEEEPVDNSCKGIVVRLYYYWLAPFGDWFLGPHTTEEQYAAFESAAPVIDAHTKQGRFFTLADVLLQISLAAAPVLAEIVARKVPGTRLSCLVMGVILTLTLGVYFCLLIKFSPMRSRLIEWVLVTVTAVQLIICIIATIGYKQAPGWLENAVLVLTVAQTAQSIAGLMDWCNRYLAPWAVRLYHKRYVKKRYVLPAEQYVDMLNEIEQEEERARLAKEERKRKKLEGSNNLANIMKEEDVLAAAKKDDGDDDDMRAMALLQQQQQQRQQQPVRIVEPERQPVVRARREQDEETERVLRLRRHELHQMKLAMDMWDI